VDAAVFAELQRVQQRLFRTTDVLMTGAVLGGGSDVLHQLVLVFTNFFQSAAGRVKGCRRFGRRNPLAIKVAQLNIYSLRANNVTS